MWRNRDAYKLDLNKCSMFHVKKRKTEPNTWKDP